MSAGAALVAAESILALTPIAIKQTPLDPLSAIWSRILSSAVLGYLLTEDRHMSHGDWLGAGALGYTNLLHVASSYEAFRNLPTGQAMSLLYTYPLWNLMLTSAFNKEHVRPREYLFIGIAAIGSILVNIDPGDAAPSRIGRTASQPWGIFMGLVMAFTESGMHTILKHLKWMDPAKSVWIVNSSAGVWLAAMMALQGMSTDFSYKGSWVDAVLLTIFHGFTVFSGYWLRFYAVPRLSTVTYSILSYTGLLASYLFGIFFMNERPGWISVLGALLIVVNGLALQISDSTSLKQ